VRDPSVDDNRVHRTIGTEGEAVGGQHLGLRPSEGQVLSRPFGEGGVNLDRGDPPLAADDLGKDRAVIARAGADVDDMHPSGQPEPVVQGGPEAGLPVVEPARLVDRD
jgi:hypothetical protein